MGSKLSPTAVLLGFGMVLAVLAPVLFVLPALNDATAEGPLPVAARPAAAGVAGAGAAAAEASPAPMPASAAAPAPASAPPLNQPPPKVLRAPAPASANPSGAQALALEQRLSSLAYLVGKVDGVLDEATRYGVTAFQKVENLPRTGVADAATLDRLQTASTPAPAFSTPPDHFEVDIARQVVFMVRGGKVAAISPTSTGSNQLFTSQGYTRRAVTPNGRFQIFFKRPGWRVSPLGRLYRPAYFNGGIALHGSYSVPTAPVSHGCVRLPMVFADWLLDNAVVGQVVYVYGGPAGENPQPVLDEPPLGGVTAAAVPGPAQAPVAGPAPGGGPAGAVPPPGDVPPPAGQSLGGLLNGLLSP